MWVTSSKTSVAQFLAEKEMWVTWCDFLFFLVFFYVYIKVGKVVVKWQDVIPLI